MVCARLNFLFEDNKTQRPFFVCFFQPVTLKEAQVDPVDPEQDMDDLPSLLTLVNEQTSSVQQAK